MFKRLSLGEWRQFRFVDVEFHPRLTVLTGANGAGKTTILNVLNRHFGWSILFLSTPVSRKGALSYYSGKRAWDEGPDDASAIGQLDYADGGSARLVVPENVKQTYDVNIVGRQNVEGIFLPSHRPVYTYHEVDQIPTKMDAREQLLEQYLSNLRNFWAANARVQSPSMRLKQSIISLATFGFGNEYVQQNQEAIDTFNGFQAVLRRVLPAALGFKRLSIRLPEVVLECEAGDVSIDGVSGGVAALIDVAWQIYLRSLVSEKFVVVADEPENHLHPQIQRTLIPGLLEAFPQAQFILATHNPFIVGSVPDSNVYVLDFVDNRVESTLLDLLDRSGTSNEILREALGVPLPTPVWVEEALKEVGDMLDVESVGADELSRARDRLEELGLVRYLPTFLGGGAGPKGD